MIDGATMQAQGKPEKARNGIVLVAGPTASGKSALASSLAEAFDGVIINADSMQVYRELAVLTARPTAADEARAPHRLYGIIPAAEPCSAGRWRSLALGEIERARGQGRMPILVGGTGLYFRALTKGLAPVPEIPPEVRAETLRLFERLGPGPFHDALAKRDPVMAGRLRRGDRQRLMRAWEVIEATGSSLAEWQALAPGAASLEGPVATLLVDCPRQTLYARCDRRFAAMVEHGAVEEVERLLDLGLEPHLPAMKAIGVRELGRRLAGEITLEQAVAAGQQATRRYAKRQRTWFGHQMPQARVISAQDSESLKSRIFPFICEILLTGQP